MKKIVCLVVLCLTTVFAYADKPLQFIVSEDISYDDNIYLTDGNKVSPAISSTQLFAKYFNSIPNSSLKFGADANIGYNAYTEAPAKNDYMNAGLGVNLSNSKFYLEDKFLYTADPATSELTDRVNRINNFASFRFRSSLERMFSIGFVASDSLDRYQEAEYENLSRNRFNVGAQLYYNISSKTSIYAGYLFSAINYEKDKDKNSLGNSFDLGVNGNITQKIKGTAQVSYDTRKYDTDIEGLDNSGELFGYLLSLKYEPTSQNSLSLFGERKMEETIYENNRYYVSTEIGLEYKQKIYNKWSVALLTSYENLAYPKKIGDVKRSDDLFKVKPSVEYKFKEYLFASLWYQFRNKSSNCDGVEYDNNKVGAQLKFTF
jgi:hypothetical protein